MTNKPTPEHTHKAILSIYSNEGDPDVWIRIDWDPSMTGEDIERLGYMPSAFKFVHQYVVPMLDSAYAETLDGLADAEPASTSVN